MNVTHFNYIISTWLLLHGFNPLIIVAVSYTCKFTDLLFEIVTLNLKWVNQVIPCAAVKLKTAYLNAPACFNNMSILQQLSLQYKYQLKFRS